MNALILALVLMQNPAGDPSLFSSTASNLFLFRDLKARNVGDVLTIQIVESASATNSANTATKKDGSVGLTAPALGGLEKGASALNFANILSGGGNVAFNGTGATTRTGQLQAAISARVTQVLPNGDLMIEGTKEVTVNRERQVLTIRGLVRARDVTPGNLVSSTSIADMDVQFDGKGMVADANKPGWFFKLFQMITPF